MLANLAKLSKKIHLASHRKLHRPTMMVLVINSDNKLLKNKITTHMICIKTMQIFLNRIIISWHLKAIDQEILMLINMEESV